LSEADVLRGLLTASASFSALLSAAIVFVLNQYQSLRESPKLAQPFKPFAKYLFIGLVFGVMTTLVSLAGLFEESVLTGYSNAFSRLAAFLFTITLLIIVISVAKVYREVTR